jgi:hypothetical protein
MDELAYRAADLPAAVRRDVAFALGLRAGAGLVPYEEGFFARLIREDMARTPCGKKVTFREVVNEWLAGKQAGVMSDEIKARTLKDAKDCIAQALEELGDKFVSEIVKKDIEKVLSKFSSYRRRNIQMRINEVFRYCQENRILGTAPENNPCYGIKWPKIKERLPEPILVDDARKLFALAVQTEDQLGCTAWIAFRMFEALRDAEASKTTYASVKGINVSRGFIHLPWEVAKKRERMVFFDPDQCPDPKLREFIPKNLKVILSELPGRAKGNLAPNRREIDMFKSYARHCGIKWKANGLRAGFASHHFALYQDAGAASKLMGHLASDGGVEVFYNHYYKFLGTNASRVPFLNDTPPVAQMCAVAGAIQWSLNRGLELPYWYFGKMNYLVPLYLQDRENITVSPDLIAPVQVSTQSLLVRTVLLPHMPYANARVAVTRHDKLPPWLLSSWNDFSQGMTGRDD